MSEEAKGPVKRQRKAKGVAPAASALYYAAMHETNVALCLASGFLAPRLEENATRDHHRAAGKVVLECSAPSARSMLQARGDLPYGVVVVVEICPDRLSTGVGVEGAELIPLLAAKRLVFASDQSRLEFTARTSAYADIPDDVLPYEVDPGLFASQAMLPGDLSGEDELDQGEPEDPSVERDNKLRSQVALLDRCAGAMAASFSTLVTPEGAGLQAALSGMGDGMGQVFSPFQVAWELAARIDAAVDAEAYRPLLANLVSLLCEAGASDGFSASSLLRKLHATLGVGSNAVGSEAMQRFIGFAQDVVGLRRDLPNAAFADVAGSAIPRGALLFLLNPEPETLAAIRVRTPGLGPRVYFVAAMLVGIRAGMSRLPSDIKSGASFLAIPSFVLAASRGEAAPLAVASRWERTGARISELAWNGYPMARARVEPVPEELALLLTVTRAGIAAAFSPVDGTLVAEMTRAEHSAKLALCPQTLPTFPRSAVVEATLHLTCTLPKRAATALMASVNEQSRETGIHCNIVEQKQGRVVQLSACLAKPLSTESLSNVQEALWTEAARWLPDRGPAAAVMPSLQP